MVEALLEKTPHWLAGDGPDASIVVASECSLLRNLADFPFPARCSEEERRSIERRMVGVLDSLRLMANGQFCRLSTSLCAAEPDEMSTESERLLAERLLVERRLVAFYEIPGRGPRGGARFESPEGVYVADDQSMSIMVNGADHLCMRVLASGAQLLETWARLNLIDDTLAGQLDFAFDERYGYLSYDLGHVGTGLTAAMILHLPALAATNQLAGLAQLAQERHQALRGFKTTAAFRIEPARGRAERPAAAGAPANSGTPRGSDAPLPRPQVMSEAIYSDWYGTLYGSFAEAEGDLFLLSNVSTLGVSEEETVFHLRHLASEVISREQQARATLQQQNGLQLKDRVARALGVARSARLLEFSEALALLSSIRLGVATGLAEEYSIRDVNELLMNSQGLHVRAKAGEDCDELTLRKRRADLFRARFSPN